MRMPEFTAEASLRPAIDRYQGNAVFGDSCGVEVLPMQVSIGAIVTGDPCFPQPWQPWLKKVPCCRYLPTGRLYCSCATYPVWFQCQNLTPWGPTCIHCAPPLFLP